MPLHHDIVENTATFVTAAFSLVAALAWNSAVQAVFKSVFGTADNIPAQIGYALVVTVIAVVATVWIVKMSNKVVKKE